MIIFLNDAGQYEEALSRAEQAMEIHQRLIQNNSDRYEPGYAILLNSIDNNLRYAGRYVEALKRAEQAIEIHQRLVRKNPNRYEPDYAISLSHIANRLSDVGRYEEARYDAKQALEIRQRLATKHPERFAYDRYCSTCEVFFFVWLINPANMEGGSVELPAIPTAVPSHRYLTLQFYKNFLLACCASEQVIRRERFKKVIAGWEKLSSADQNNTQDYWLCAAAWCATFSPEIIADTGWLASWKKFKEQRQGRIPAWMERTAENLSFQWPE
ncbi:MAG: tetratricopeptide repeat protein [Candidatus Electrothrix sp. ATG2]|nr:tetratricopeptide repeat protein [Candidatus Electrothrix sp. ATG2]